MGTELKPKDKTALDASGNPVGTTYSPTGIPSCEGGITLPTLPAPAEYNTDGTVFAAPADAAVVLGKFKTDIAGKQLTITENETAIAGTKKMAALQPEDVRHIFEKPIASVELVLATLKAEKIALETAKAKYELLLELPSVRGAKSELIDVRAEIAKLKIREAELVILTKGSEVAKKDATVTTSTPAGTDEQKANYTADLAIHLTQGKCIVAKVQLGWTNAKIANYYGIAPANVPGPKNVYLRSAAGIEFIAANPGLVDSIK